jgi:hypothetical protein
MDFQIKERDLIDSAMRWKQYLPGNRRAITAHTDRAQQLFSRSSAAKVRVGDSARRRRGDVKGANPAEEDEALGPRVRRRGDSGGNPIIGESRE